MNSSDFLLGASREYAIYVCSNRAIPSVMDGLKHGQRMALWVIKDKPDKIKTVALGGLLQFRKIYVHGDAACNQAISQLAAPYKNNVPLINGHGAFGSRIAADAWGHPRYTSCSRSKAAEAFLYNDTGLVPMEPNYDYSEMQPRHFLPLIPVVLLNGVTGIAVGWSTNILPHSLKDLIHATKSALKGEPIKPLIPSYARYDVAITSTGTNQWELRGRAAIKDTSTVRITELPPGMAIETFRKKLIAMEDSEQIVSFIDRSTESIDITVKMKRGSVATWTADTAIDYFKLHEKVTERLVVIGWDGKSIRTYASPEELVQDFVAWRLQWFTRRFDKLLADDSYELGYWLAVDVLFEGKFPKRLGGFLDRESLTADVVKTLSKQKIVLDDKQLDRIVSLPTYRWTQTFAAEVKAKIAELQQSIAEYNATLASPERLRAVYLEEIERLRGAKL